MRDAVRLARQAAIGGHPEFLAVVADVYVHGRGDVKPNLANAALLLRVAASLGDAGAAATLAHLPPPTSAPAP